MAKQTHSSNYMNLLEFLHDRSCVPIPHRLPHICLSRMRVKSQFSKQKLFILENSLPNFDKNIKLPSEVNCWIFSWSSSEVICWTTLQADSSENLLEIPFTNIFVFLSISCHALTPNILGCPSAYGMHDANSNTFMLIYSHAYILT